MTYEVLFYNAIYYRGCLDVIGTKFDCPICNKHALVNYGNNSYPPDVIRWALFSCSRCRSEFNLLEFYSQVGLISLLQ